MSTGFRRTSRSDLPALISRLGLAGESETITRTFDVLVQLDGPHSEDATSALSSVGSPVELCLVMGRAGSAGLQYTVDPAPVQEDDDHRIAFAMERIETLLVHLNWLAAVRSVDTVFHRVFQQASRLSAVYCSVAHFPDRPMKVKAYLAAAGLGWSGDEIDRICRSVGRPASHGSTPRLLEAAGAERVHMIGLTLIEGTLRSAKLYVFKPYMSLAVVNRLASAANVSLRAYFLLLRWYRSFVGGANGRLGWYGIGLDPGQAEQPGVELYVQTGGSRHLDDASTMKWIRRHLPESKWHMVDDILSARPGTRGDRRAFRNSLLGVGFQLPRKKDAGHLGIYFCPDARRITATGR